MAAADPGGSGLRCLLGAALLLAAIPGAPPVRAQLEAAVPESLREGWGFGHDIRDFGESLDGGYELTERDVDCDGEPEVLLEWLLARGATGNRLYALFDHTATGYRYLGECGAIWAVVDYGEGGGCYLASYTKSGGQRLTLSLSAVGGGELDLLGRIEMTAGDAASDDDNAVLSALRTGSLEEDRLRRLADVTRLRPVELAPRRPLPWVETSTIEEVIETVEGYGPQVFERVLPEEVGRAGRDAWWSAVSARTATVWAGAVERAVVEGAVADSAVDRPPWLPPPASGRVKVLSTRVEDAVRLNLSLGRPPVGVAVGRFHAELAGPAAEPARRVEITWAALIATTRLGEAEGILRLFVGSAGDGESRRILRLERVTNLDHDRDPEVVLDEEAYAGRVQWVLDVSRRGEVDVRRLHADAWD